MNWTDRKEFMLIMAYPYVTNPRDLAVIMHVSYVALKSRVSLLKLRRAVPHARDGSSTPKEERYIRKNYLQMPSKRMATALGRSDTFIRGTLRRMKLVIPPEIIEQRKQASRLKPGSVPPNKGKKMPKALYEKCKATMFKAGQLPGNTLYDGAIVVRNSHKKRNGRAYKWIRMANAKWKMYHVLVWEQKNGPVPAGHIIVFINGDSMNCNLDNLKCVTRKQHAINSQQSDGYIAMTMSHEKGKRGAFNRELMETLKGHKDLIDLKRKSLQLKRAIHEQREAKTDNAHP